MSTEEKVTTIIGLEVHVQLRTNTKLFCGCSTLFGEPANTQTCPVCIGMPGALPVANEQALEFSIKTGLALNCEIATVTNWDRKNYFYPDLPKGYQISQLDHPICGRGHLDIVDPTNELKPRPVRITRAHLEEDAGKSIHDETGAQGQSKIDLNRTGTPLLEIVTEPDLRSGAEAKCFLAELKLILSYLDVSDCNMQQGSLRVDANVNLHIESGGKQIATPIVEVKNLNSFRAVERALNYEEKRQLDAWRENGLGLGDVSKSTRGWDDRSQATILQREKEESSDYRYFPDPDLVPIEITPALIQKLKDEILELPAAARQRLSDEFELSDYDADVLVGQGREVVSYFESVAEQTGDNKLAANWVTQEVLRYLNEHTMDIQQYPVDTEKLAGLLKLVQTNQLDQSRAKSVLEKMVLDRVAATDAMNALGMRQLPRAELESICLNLIESNPKVVEQVRAGNIKAVGSLIGAAKKLEPNIDAGQVRKILLEKIGN